MNAYVCWNVAEVWYLMLTNDLSTMSRFSETYPLLIPVTEESLLEILDKGTSDESESFGVEFRRIIIILASNVDNERIIAGSQIFKHRPDIVVDIPMNQNQNAKIFRTELLNRVEGIMFFDPLVENGGIPVLCRRNGGFDNPDL